MKGRVRRLRTSAHGPWKEVQEFESCSTNLGLISLAYPDYARFNEAVGFGTKKEAHRLARGKGNFGLQTQAMSGEVNGSSEVFTRASRYYASSCSRIDGAAPPCAQIKAHGINDIATIVMTDRVVMVHFAWECPPSLHRIGITLRHLSLDLIGLRLLCL